MIRAFAVVLVAFTLLFVFIPPLILYSALVGNADLLYRVGMWGVRVVLRVAGVKLEVSGQDKTPIDRAVVFMANHQGNCDPLAVIVNLPRVLVIGKKELFRVPFLGWGMRQCGFIPVDRKRRERAVGAVKEAIEALKSGHSFMVFPEGTRSRDGRLQPFKKGVFIMAIEAGAPIVPISVSGSARIMRKGEFVVRPGVVRLVFHDPIPTQGLTLEDRDDLSEQVRAAILSELAEDERPLKEGVGG